MKRGGMPVGATVRCTNCGQVWLVPGLRRGETHVCKGCGQRLLVGGRAERPPGKTTRVGGRARASTTPAARSES
jgi:DNA-directed RNA polymerase subunit RPC12/RpoP